MKLDIQSIPRRSLLLGSAAFLTGCAIPALPDIPGVYRKAQAFELLGETYIPYRQQFEGTTVGGLSAIDYDPKTRLFDLLSDDRSDYSPARFYRVQLTFDGKGLAPPELIEVVTLKQGNGIAWPNRANAAAGVPVPDPEAMRRLPDGSILWTSEGDFPRRFPPAVYHADASGRLLREFDLPPCFAVGAEHGARNNLAFEGLAIDEAGTQAWVSMENALLQDGAKPSIDSPGGPCRFTLFDVARGTASRQIAYRLDPIPARPLLRGTFADNGVSEILMLDSRRLLVLERAYVAGKGISLRIYCVDTEDGTDTLDIDTLNSTNHRVARKRLVVDFSNLKLSRLDNTEGMTWGPRLSDGRRTLFVVSDDNFNPLQVTQIAMFAVNEELI